MIAPGQRDFKLEPTSPQALSNVPPTKPSAVSTQRAGEGNSCPTSAGIEKQLHPPLQSVAGKAGVASWHDLSLAQVCSLGIAGRHKGVMGQR